ncbi:aspartate kinase [Vibrio zhugei]|uniref:aspartate kinase n=1 Tax=Vibrio zhugei TaxID=2479546 RepID=A0ABV7C7A2_9VIBR|nr:aspartate kinase [Vibrio zhugei]
MSHTVEKIGGTSMAAFDAVLDNILLKPKNVYQRIFVVSAFAGITDALLECKKTAQPGIFRLVEQQDEAWESALEDLRDRLLLINDNIFADPMLRQEADEFINGRLDDTKQCIQHILTTCQYGQFSLEQYLPQIREFIAALGEVHSAFNTVLKLRSLDINAVFIDLSGWEQDDALPLDDKIKHAFQAIDLSNTLPIVTGYTQCEEGLMDTYDRGYSEMTFSRIASLLHAKKAIIHKEFHLSSADPKLVGMERVRVMGKTNYDVADQLACLGMEAIHPNAAAGLREQGIELVVKNTFDPDHPGTSITDQFDVQPPRVEIIAGQENAYALHFFDQTLVGRFEDVAAHIGADIAEYGVHLISKEMNANSITYFLSGSQQAIDQVISSAQSAYPHATVSVLPVAIISAIGACLETSPLLASGIQALAKHDIELISAHSTLRTVNVQFIVKAQEYGRAVQALHQALIEEVDEAINKSIYASSSSKAA